MEFACSVCQYTSSKKENVLRHINKKKGCGSGIREIVEIPIEIKCEFCNKHFATVTSLTRHQKDSCKSKVEILEKQLKAATDKIKEANEKNKELERQLKDKPTTVNFNTFNIVVNNYENTSFEKITDKIYSKLINTVDEPYQIIPRLIREVHFNPNIPENHNVYLSNRNKNNKHLQIFKDNHWEVVNKDSEIDNLIVIKKLT